MNERGEDWFTTIYHTHYGQIVNYGRRRRLDGDGAAELAQEVFIVAWRRRTDVPAHSLPWLYGVARRLLANSRRAAPLPVPVPDLGHLVDPPSVDAEADVGLVEVRAALAGLSEPDQEILRLVGWEELTVSEAAVVLGCTRATAAVRLHRARRRLVAALARTRS
ncbi:MAG: sigma-70 family RNA polymerase sigma factor [Actinobacteria bacterium]|nr:MAG: sigma-70 family RNA polymerase sigma factor [Actinomycetota bacterium]